MIPSRGPARHARAARRRWLRTLAVYLALGATIAGLDLALLGAVADLADQPDTAVLVNCLLGVGLCLLALHPASPRAHRHLVRVLARRRPGRLLLRATSTPRAPARRVSRRPA